MNFAARLSFNNPLSLKGFLKFIFYCLEVKITTIWGSEFLVTSSLVPGFTNQPFFLSPSFITNLPNVSNSTPQHSYYSTFPLSSKLTRYIFSLPGYRGLEWYQIHCIMWSAVFLASSVSYVYQPTSKPVPHSFGSLSSTQLPLPISVFVRGG